MNDALTTIAAQLVVFGLGLLLGIRHTLNRHLDSYFVRLVLRACWECGEVPTLRKRCPHLIERLDARDRRDGRFWRFWPGRPLYRFLTWCRWPLPTQRHRTMRAVFGEYVKQWDL